MQSANKTATIYIIVAAIIRKCPCFDVVKQCTVYIYTYIPKITYNNKAVTTYIRILFFISIGLNQGLP